MLDVVRYPVWLSFVTGQQRGSGITESALSRGSVCLVPIFQGCLLVPADVTPEFFIPDCGPSNATWHARQRGQADGDLVDGGVHYGATVSCVCAGASRDAALGQSSGDIGKDLARIGTSRR